MLYSNTIFTNIFGKSNSYITAREATYLIAGVNFVASFISIGTVRLAGRRTLLLTGHCVVALCHLMIGISIIMESATGVLIMTCVFMFVY